MRPALSGCFVAAPGCRAVLCETLLSPGAICKAEFLARIWETSWKLHFASDSLPNISALVRPSSACHADGHAHPTCVFGCGSTPSESQRGRAGSGVVGTLPRDSPGGQRQAGQR
ncbi:hypothetical protein B0T17DRAFT_515075 [Bombardia bombarda]|uniref:Uncharacterized protein n=1 Tax=Bombardia bombarda TaxID=252184 RepID=A0AA39XKK0_9PEZI|nr:hypothetical protein B0T17DRAFT_515075 [Bombardia bombarda]